MTALLCFDHQPQADQPGFDEIFNGVWVFVYGLGDGSYSDRTDDCGEIFEDSAVELGQAEFVDVWDLEHFLDGLLSNLSCSVTARRFPSVFEISSVLCFSHPPNDRRMTWDAKDGIIG